VVLKTLKSTPGFVLGRCLTPVRAKCTYSFGEFPLRVLPSAVNVKKIFVLFTFCCSRLSTVVLLLLFNTSTLFSS
jgi:hypothetical protein